MHLPLNALRAFEASARNLNRTRAAQVLHVTQTAVSQHIRKLEDRLGKPLFRRLPSGLALTAEGQALLPVVTESFSNLARALEKLGDTRPREVLTVGAVGTFAVGWLLPRLRDFQQACPFVDPRLLPHNNRVDIAGEGGGPGRGRRAAPGVHVRTRTAPGPPGATVRAGTAPGRLLAHTAAIPARDGGHARLSRLARHSSEN